jgi:tetratricopeptide (TPR) repeat protein
MVGSQKQETVNRRRDLAIGVLIIATILVVYGQVRHYDFVNLDDPINVYRNAHVMKGLTGQGVAWAFTTMQTGHWHPLTWLSHLIVQDLFGLDAGYHHLVNVFLHILNSLLLYLLLRRMTGGLWRSAMVAVLFALHPLHVESVAWITERKDVLSTLFFMLTLLSYGWYVDRPSVTRYGVVLGCLALGLMAKPMLVTTPFVLLLLDYWPLGRLQPIPDLTSAKRGSNASGTKENDRRLTIAGLLVEKVPLFVLVIASSVVSYIAAHQGDVQRSAPFGFRIANALVSYVAYLGNLVWPTDLAVFYPYRGSISVVQWLGAFVVLAGVSGVLIWAGRRWRYLTVGWLWFMGTLVPVIGLIQVGEQSMADRFTYIPAIGIFIMVVWGVAELTSDWRHGHVQRAIVACAVSLGCIVGSWFQTTYWQNSVTLFQHALDVTKDNYLAHINLGEALELQGHTEKAIPHYEEALRIRPHYYLALYNLGSALGKQGRLEKAEGFLREALTIEPTNADAHSTLGFILTKRGTMEEAIEHLNKALAINPEHAAAYNNLGTAFYRQGKLSQALDQYRKVLTIEPRHREAANNVGIMLMKQGKRNEAIEQFREVLKFHPDFAEAHNDLAIVLAVQGRKDEAIEQFREVIRIDPTYPDAQNKLNFLLNQ